MKNTDSNSKQSSLIRSYLQTNHSKIWSMLRIGRRIFFDLRQEWKMHRFGMIGRHIRRIIREYNLAKPNSIRSKYLWLDLGELGSFTSYDEDGWQDHGLGLLRTIMHQNSLPTELVSVRNFKTLEQVGQQIKGYDLLLMNVRSYNFEIASKCAALFKQQNPQGLVVVGGMHCTVSPESMEAVPEFDKICKGAGEEIIVDLVRDPSKFPRVFEGKGSSTMESWPKIDRTLWPKPANFFTRALFYWPLERGMSWGPQPQVSMLTSRVCPWACSFCNEASYIPKLTRRPVEMVIDELNELDEKYGFESITFHDSMFFQNRKWLETWLELYPKRARRIWPYWAAARADTVYRWPDLFEALVLETNWNVVSIGFETHSDRMLRVLNKQVTKAQNEFSVNLINRIGDKQEQSGIEPVKIWGNVMFAIPGETKEEAFDTYRLLKKMHRVFPSVAYYTAYSGTALGFQIIAEGKDQKNQHVRDAMSKPIKGIDYEFYRELLSGTYAQEVNQGLAVEDQERVIITHSGQPLETVFGKRKGHEQS